MHKDLKENRRNTQSDNNDEHEVIGLFICLQVNTHRSICAGHAAVAL